MVVVLSRPNDNWENIDMQCRFSVALAVCLPTLAVAAPAPKPMAVCVNQATGAVTARAKCKAGEVPLNLATVAALAVGPTGPTGPVGPEGKQGIAGPQGEKGALNVASCYRLETPWYESFDDGANVADLDCNDPKTEFMLSDGYDTIPDPPDIAVTLSQRFPLTLPGDTVPTGIMMYSVSDTKAYQLRGFITCCKR